MSYCPCFSRFQTTRNGRLSFRVSKMAVERFVLFFLAFGFLLYSAILQSNLRREPHTAAKGESLLHMSNTLFVAVVVFVAFLTMIVRDDDMT
jgi:hypothetical protein